MVTVANAHDHVWQKRRRALNTFIVMLFIFRLVFSSTRPGYTITLIELFSETLTKIRHIFPGTARTQIFGPVRVVGPAVRRRCAGIGSGSGSPEMASKLADDGFRRRHVSDVPCRITTNAEPVT